MFAALKNSSAFNNAALAVLLVLAMLAASPHISAQQLTRSNSSFTTALRNQPLPIDVAFPFIVSMTGRDTVSIRWNPAPQHYLYRHRFQIRINGVDPQVIDFQIPNGRAMNDAFFGDIEAYYDSVELSFTLPAKRPKDLVLTLDFQGCADWGFCYPPQTVDFPL